MESALVAIQSIEKHHSVEDIDEDLILFLGSDQYDVRLMSMLVFGESNLEPDKGQRLVVHTVLNRKQSPHFHDTVEGVVYAPSQFCATKLGSWGTYTGQNMQNVLLAYYLRKYELTSQEEMTLLYFNNQTVNDIWYANKYKLSIEMTVGNHTFFSRGVRK
jgi:spore germination cell wall hydrolase CwlJ-like protein